MGRRPGVFVRSVSMEEGRRLQRIGRTSKDPVRLRRAIVVLMSAQGQAVRDITSLLHVSFVPQPKRWVVEQVNGTLMLHRRLVRDYDHRPDNAASRVYWASTAIMLRCLTAPSPAWRDDVELAA